MKETKNGEKLKYENRKTIGRVHTHTHTQCNLKNTENNLGAAKNLCNKFSCNAPTNIIGKTIEIL